MQMIIRKLVERKNNAIKMLKKISYNKQVQQIELEKCEILVKEQKRKLKKHKNVLKEIEDEGDMRVSSQNPINIYDNLDAS